MRGRGETDIEMVRRHIRQGEITLAHQRELTAKLVEDNAETLVARQLLATFEDLQRSHVEHLARLKSAR